MPKILIAEDEPHLRGAIAKTLSAEGYTVAECADGRAALDLFSSEHIDLIITDVMMPRMDGNRLAAEIRKSSAETPILMLTALESIGDKERGFASGTDDYLVKPVLMRELCLRVKAMLRRCKIYAEQRVSLPHTELDFKTQTLSISGRAVNLNKKELFLLFTLLSSPNVIFSRERLLNEIWGYDSDTVDRTVDTHISWLREKAASPDYEIATVWGLGYKAVLK